MRASLSWAASVVGLMVMLIVIGSTLFDVWGLRHNMTGLGLSCGNIAIIGIVTPNVAILLLVNF